MTLGIPKIVSFFIHQDCMYVLDQDGTMWKNPYLNNQGKWIEGWTPLVGPSRAEHRKEEIKSRERYNIARDEEK